MILGYTYVVVLLLSSENAARLTEVKRTCCKHSPGGMEGLDRISFQPKSENLYPGEMVRKLGKFSENQEIVEYPNAA